MGLVQKITNLSEVFKLRRGAFYLFALAILSNEAAFADQGESELAEMTLPEITVEASLEAPNQGTTNSANQPQAVTPPSVSQHQGTTNLPPQTPAGFTAPKYDPGLQTVLNKVRAHSGQHSACYLEPGAKPELKGVNVEKQVRLASVTKLLTSYWVVSRLGPRYQFKTNFIWDPTTAELFIQGSRDPFFGRRRLLLLISDLSRLGIRQINKVYFDKNFRYFQAVESPSTYHTEITQNGGVSRATVVKQLMHLMNTRNWGREDRSQYDSFRKTASVLGVKTLAASELNLKVLEVSPADTNPLEGRNGLESYTSQSPQVMNYLKILNMHSMNYPADELFYRFGGRQSFAKFLVEKLNFDESDARVFTGSGLPFRASGERSDTTTSCDVMIKVLVDMRAELAKYNLDLPDIMMIGGVDRGTLNGIYKQAPLRGAVVAKTGTLANALTLAGFINTNQGRVYFGVFFQTNQIAQARTARNQAVLRIAKQHGGTKPLKPRNGFQFVSFGPYSNLKKNNPSASAILP